MAELAAAVAGTLHGDGEVRIAGIRSLERAGPGDLSFYTDAGYREQLASSRAGALLAPPALASEALVAQAAERPLLVVEHPPLALAKLIPFFHPAVVPSAGIHPTAVVGDGCEIDAGAHVGPYAVIGAGSRLGAGAVVHPHVVIGRDCVVGAGAVLHPHVVLYDRSEVGERTVVHAGAVLGADGFGYATHGGEHVKVPQVGRMVLESDVEVGALAAIDRAVLEETRIGAGTKIDNLVQIGHNVTLGRGCILSGQAGVAGSTKLGDYVVLAGQSGVSGHIELGQGVQVAAKSAVLQSVPPGRKVAGVPAFELSKWRRVAAVVPRLGELFRRLRSLEKKVESISAGK